MQERPNESPSETQMVPAINAQELLAILPEPSTHVETPLEIHAVPGNSEGYRQPEITTDTLASADLVSHVEEQLPEVSEPETTSKIDVHNWPVGPHAKNDVTGLEVIPPATKDITTMVLPGFLETPQTLKTFMSSMAERGGRRVIALHQPRHAHHEQTDEQQRAGYTDGQVDRAQRVLKAITKNRASTQEEQVDLVGHSQGAIDAVLAARIAVNQYPGMIRNILLVNPAGVTGTEHNHFKTAWRTMHEMADNTKEAVHHPGKFLSIARAIREAVQYIGEDPLGARREAKDTLQTDILNSLEELREFGIGVTILAGVDDHLFHGKEFQSWVSSSLVDGFSSVQGGHNDIWLKPDKLALASTYALDSMRDLQEKRKIQSQSSNEGLAV